MKALTFDCYGTLINFQMAEAAQDLYAHRLDAPAMNEFVRNFSAYRLDEVMQAWKPYAEVVHNALERTCRRNNVPFRTEDAQLVYDRVPNWGHIRTSLRAWQNSPRRSRWSSCPTR